MKPLVVLATFALVFPAELPDKTFIASLVLGTRFPAFPVWIGVTAAFVVHSAIAVGVGGLLGLLPHQVVDAIVAALFAAGAIYLFAVPETTEERRGTAAAAVAPGTRRVVLTSFGVIFLAEWGDITQILTANLAARYHSPASVFAGAALALAVVAGIAVVTGRTLPRFISITAIRRLTGVALAVLAIVSAVQSARA